MIQMDSQFYAHPKANLLISIAYNVSKVLLCYIHLSHPRFHSMLNLGTCFYQYQQCVHEFAFLIKGVTRLSRLLLHHRRSQGALSL